MCTITFLLLDAPFGKRSPCTARRREQRAQEVKDLSVNSEAVLEHSKYINSSKLVRTWTPKVCKIMAFRASFFVLGIVLHTCGVQVDGPVLPMGICKQFSSTPGFQKFRASLTPTSCAQTLGWGRWRSVQWPCAEAPFRFKGQRSARMGQGCVTLRALAPKQAWNGKLAPGQGPWSI